MDALQAKLHDETNNNSDKASTPSNNDKEAPAKKVTSKAKAKNASAKAKADGKPSWPGGNSDPSILCEWYVLQNKSKKRSAGKDAFELLHGTEFSASEANLKRYRRFIDYVGYSEFLEWTKSKSPRPHSIRDSWKRFPVEWDRAKFSNKAGGNEGGSGVNRDSDD